MYSISGDESSLCQAGVIIVHTIMTVWMEGHMPKITKMGNSLGVTIPKEALERLGLSQGDEVEVRARGSILEVVPVVKRLKLRPFVQAAYEEALEQFGPAFDRLAK